MGSRPHGYTFLGRYNILDRATHKPGRDWRIETVFDLLGSDISSVVSLGCSVGINEILLAIKNPQVRVTALDIDNKAIEKARAGMWTLDDIRPSGLCFGIGSDNETLRRLYSTHCPESYFDINFSSNTLRLIKPVENVCFQVKDGTRTEFLQDSFDLAVMYMVSPSSSTHGVIGREIERIVKPNGLLWHESGLYKILPSEAGQTPYRRVLNRKLFYELEDKLTAREEIFPSKVSIV